MTDEQLKRIAAERMAFLVANNPPLAGVTIPMVAYKSPADYASVVIEPDEMTYFEHRQCMGYLAEMLAAVDARPIFMDIEPKKYLRWLKKNKIINGTGSRAAYVAEIYTGQKLKNAKIMQVDDLQ